VTRVADLRPLSIAYCANARPFLASPTQLENRAAELPQGHEKDSVTSA